MMCAWKKFAVVSMTVLAMGTGAVWAQEPSDSLKDGFVNPPSGARPRVWWHWMNGNISQPGIKLDLEWMHRVGIAGFPEFRCCSADAASGGSPFGVHDTRVERGVQIRDHAGGSVGHGRSDRRLTGLERVGRTLGIGPRGHEEIRVERNRCRRRQALQRSSAASPVEYGCFSECKHSRSAAAAGGCANSSVLFRYRGHRVPRPASDVTLRRCTRRSPPVAARPISQCCRMAISRRQLEFRFQR